MTQDTHSKNYLFRLGKPPRPESDRIGARDYLEDDGDELCVHTAQTATRQLQKKVRHLRELLQRKDLELDLLRQKVTRTEENMKNKLNVQVQLEHDEVTIRKLKQEIDSFHTKLAEAKRQLKDLHGQLDQAGDYKVTAMERARKIEQLEKRLCDSEKLRAENDGKISILKDQLRATDKTLEQERSVGKHSTQYFHHQISKLKEKLTVVAKREGELQTFREKVATSLGVVPDQPISDNELVAKLESVVEAHHEFSMMSKTFQDNVRKLSLQTRARSKN